MGLTKRIIVALLAITIQLAACSKLFIAMEPEGMAQSVGTVLRLFASNGGSNETEIVDRIVVQDVEEGSGLRSVFSIHPLALQKKAKPVFNYCIERKFANSYEIAIGLLRVGSTFDNDEHLEIIKVPIVENMYATSSTGLFTVDSMVRVGFPIPIYVSSTQEVNYDVPDENNSELDDTEIDAVEIVAQKIPGLMGERSIVPLPCSIRLNGVSQFLTAAIIDSKFKGYPSVIIRPMFKTINRNVIVKQLTVLLASEDGDVFIQSELQVKRNTIDDSLKILDTVTIAAKANESLVINRIIIRDEQKEETMEDVYLNQPIVMLRNSYGILTDWIVSEKFNKSKSLRFIALFDNIEYGMELTLPLENEFTDIGIIENSDNESQEQNSTEVDESLNNQIFEGPSGEMMENIQKSITESTSQSQLQEADMEVPQFDHVDSLKTLSAQSLNRDTANDLDASEGKVNSLKKKYRQVKRERSKSSFDFKDESKPVSNDSNTADSASLLSEEQMEPGVEKCDDVIKGTETQQENDNQQTETYQDNANEQCHEEITCIDNVTEGQMLERAQSIKDLNSVSEPSECNEKPKESVSSNSSTETSFSNSQYEGNDNDSKPCDAQAESISDSQPECQAQSSLINIDESTEQSSLSECIADKLWHISNIQSKMPPKKYFVFKSTPTDKLFPLVVDVEDSGKLSKRVSARSILKIFPFDAGEEQMSVRECLESKSKHVANIIAHNAKDNYVVFKNTENNHLLPFTIDITPNIISEHYEPETNNKNCENCQSREDGQAGEQDASIDKSFTEHSVERTGSTSSLSKESSKGSPTHNDEVANEARRLSKSVPKASISGISDIIEKFETSSSAQSSASVSSSRKVSTSAAAANVSKENTSRKDSSSLKGGNAFQNLVKTLSPVKATTDQLMERVAEGYVAKIIKNAFSVVTEKEKENVEQKRRPIYIKKAAKYEKEQDVRQDMDEEEGRQVMNEELDNSPLSEFQLKELQQESELKNSENEIENDLQQQEVAVSRSVDQTLDVMDGAEQPKIEEQFEKESEHLFQTEEQLNVEDKLNDEKLLQNDQNLNGEELFQTEQPNLNEPLRIKEQPNVEEQSQNEEKLDPNEQNYVEEQLQSKELLHDEEQHNDESNYQNEEQHNDESNYQNEQQSQSNNTQNLNEQYPQLLTISTNAPKIAFNFIISATNLTSSPISIASIELLSNCDAFFNYPLQQPITIDPDTIASVFTCQLSEMFQYGDIVYVKAYDAEGLCVSNFYAAGIVAATDADFTLSVRQQLIDVGGMLEVYATSAIGTEVTWIRVYSDECDCTVEEHFDVPVPMHGNDSVKCIATIILPYDFVRCETIRIQAYSNSTALGTPITVQIASIVVDAIMDSYTVQVGVPFKVNVVTQQMAKIDLITIRSEGCDDVETIRVIPPIEIRSSECTLPPIVLSEAYSDVDAVKMQLWFNDMQILRDPIELQVECGRIQLDSVSREVYDDQIHSIDITGKSVNDATVSFDEVRAWVNDEKWNALIFTTAENSLMASTLHGANETVICTIQTQLLQLTTADSVNIQAFRNGKELSDTYVLPIIHVKPRVVGVELPEFDIEDEGLLVRSIKAKDTIQFVMKCHRTDYPSVTFRGISIVLQVPKDNDAIEGAATATNAVEEEVIFKEDIRYNLFATPEHSNAANSFQLNSAAQTDAFPIVPIYKWTVPFSMNNVGKVHLFLRYSADISDRFGNVVEICSRQREVTLNIVSSRASILSHFPLEHFDYAGLGHAIESTTAPSAPINIPESKTQEKQKTKRSTRFKKR